MKKKQPVLSAHIAQGTPHFGNMQSLVSELAQPKQFKGTDIQLVDTGIIFSHQATKKKIFVPFANIKSVAIPWDSDYGQEEDRPLEVSKSLIQEEIDRRNEAKGKK